jgi:hypothetical protein
MHSSNANLSLVALTTCLALAAAAAQSPASSTDLTYQTPPAVMVKILDAAPTPTLSLSPAHAPGPRVLLVEQSSSLPTVADLAEPELRLAGLRFNPSVASLLLRRTPPTGGLKWRMCPFKKENIGR